MRKCSNLNRFLNKAERIIRNDYNERGLIVCARIDNVFAINYNDIPFIVSVNVAPFNVIVYSIALSSDSKNYIIKSRGTCGNQEDVINDIYVDLLHYVRDNNICLETAETTEETAEKHYADYTSEDFIKEGIAKECTTCPDFCEEDCIENAECSRGNDVFDGCKTVKDVMEVKQELNTSFGKEQYFDTDSVQPNKAIIAKIENINHCPNQNTCCIVSPFIHCDYNYKSDSCIKAHKNFIHDCEQVHKQMKARSNPEWHHVNLETFRNIDIDMLDEKRKVYLSFYKKWQEVRKNLKKCSCGYSYERRYISFRRLLTIALDKKKISKELVEYFDRQISMVNVECGVWSSAFEVATGAHESRKYNKANLRY